MNKHRRDSLRPVSGRDHTSTQTSAWRRWAPRHYWALLLILIAVFSVSIRVLGELSLDHSALLYVALPFGIALALLLLSKAPYRGFSGVMRGSLIVLLGSSAMLHEGFLCVLFLMPIYFLMVGLAYGIHALWQRKQGGRERLQVSLLPVLVLMSSVEGVVPGTTLQRAQSVQVTWEGAAAAAEVTEQLLTPRLLTASDDWMLWLFPMPYRIDAQDKRAGAVHELFYEYRRWIFTNTKRGSIRLRLDEVSEERIAVRVLDDSSYLSTYLGLQRTRFDLLPLPGGGTRVRLTLWFERHLDPAWYFQPMQRYAVTAMGEHILQQYLGEGRRHEG